ncbi:MAG: fumarylacetoacetate hydrolase family protein [bacterium]|nr:fumarylacetoacetate hydrolase family protein [bacterium]
MKFVTFSVASPAGNIHRVGALKGPAGEQKVVDLALAYAARLQAEDSEPRFREYADFRLPQDMAELMAGGLPALNAAQLALEYVDFKGNIDKGPKGEQLIYALAEVRLLAPVPRPVSFRDFLTFEEHKAAGARRRNATVDPLWYEMPSAYKGNRLTLIGPDEELHWPHYTEKLDYELELGMFIGKSGKNIPENKGMDHIFGFTILNDFSARDIQIEEMKLWLGPHKGKDFGSAIGPCVVTKDEFDPSNAAMIARVNGEEWSRGNAGNMHFSWGRVIEHASMEEELLPGEFFGSGTVGTGCGADLGKWIQPGDVVELEIEGIGILRNKIVRDR